jgi:hypothetical protein
MKKWYLYQYTYISASNIQQHVNSANSGDVDNDSQSDCHSDLDSCAPEVMVPDARVFSSIKNEQQYPWLYDSVVHQVYLMFIKFWRDVTQSVKYWIILNVNVIC